MSATAGTVAVGSLVQNLDSNGNAPVKAQYFPEIAKGSVSSGTVTFSFSAGQIQTLTVAGAVTVAFNGWPAAGNEAIMMLKVTNGSTNITWPTVNWMKTDGTGTFTTTFPYTLQTTGIDFVLIWSDDGGTTIYGKVMR